MRSFFLLFLSLAMMMGVKAQEKDAAQLFIDMPNELLLQLEDAWRKDLVELYRAGKPASLDNIMGGRSTLLQLTPDYLLLQTSEKNTFEMKLLPLVNSTSLLCVINTVYGPVPDSRVRFFSTEWKLLDRADLWQPVANEWFIQEGVDRQSEAYQALRSFLDLDLVHYRLSADSTSMTAHYMTPEYLSEAQRQEIVGLFKEQPKVYRWKATRFE